MPRYRERPVVVEAEQFLPENGVWPDGIIPWRDITPRDTSLYEEVIE